MKTLFATAFFLTLSIGISGLTVTPAWGQVDETFRAAMSAETLGPNVVGTFAVENDPSGYRAPPVDDTTARYSPEFSNSQTYQSNIVTDDNLFAEVKNVNFFGVDRDQCCDEWAGMCDCKSPKYDCGCGGLKSNKGHLGIFWLKRKYGGDGCDYCHGGCCEKDCGSRLCDLLKCCSLKNCFKKCCGKDPTEDAVEGNAEPTQTTVFGRPLESNCRRCGGCDKGCPPKKGCDSCK